MTYEDYVLQRPFLSDFYRHIIGKEDQSCFYSGLSNDEFRKKASELIGEWQCSDCSIGDIAVRLEQSGYFTTKRDDKEACEMALAKYKKALGEKLRQFYFDLATELGVADNPKYHILVELVWNQIKVDYSFSTAELLERFAKLYAKFSVLLK